VNHFSKIVTGFVMTAGCVLTAQTGPGYIAESKTGFAAIRENVQKMAEAMPEESYSFKPTPDIRSFGELMAHIADAQARMCSSAAGSPKNVGAAAKKTKAEIVAAVKESSAICDAAFDSLTDATASQPGGMMGRTKLGLLQYNTGHSLEEYGYGSVYLRLRGIVPPSSAPKTK
jgi:hypothetical protein